MPETIDMATLGPAGTYSEAAARRYALDRSRVPRMTFGPVEHCLAMVEDGQVECAVLPAENMVDGLIGATFDALIEFSPTVRIMDELHLPIAHVLAARLPLTPSGISRVYSHPSALNQCARLLSSIVPSAILIPVGSTAEAASGSP